MILLAWLAGLLAGSGPSISPDFSSHTLAAPAAWHRTSLVSDSSADWIRTLSPSVPGLHPRNPYALPWGDGPAHRSPYDGAPLRDWQKVVDYLAHRDELPSWVDGICIFGSDDEWVPFLAARLFWRDPATPRAGYVVTSGGVGWGTPRAWADEGGEGMHYGLRMAAFDPHLRLHETLWVENESRNSGENAEFSRLLILEKKLLLRSVLIVQGPLYQRRAYLTAKKAFGDSVRVYSYAPYLPLLETFAPDAQQRALKDVVREVYRLVEYSGRFFEPIEVPEWVLAATQEITETLLADSTFPKEFRGDMQVAGDRLRRALGAA